MGPGSEVLRSGHVEHSGLRHERSLHSHVHAETRRLPQGTVALLPWLSDTMIYEAPVFNSAFVLYCICNFFSANVVQYKTLPRNAIPMVHLDY